MSLKISLEVDRLMSILFYGSVAHFVGDFSMIFGAVKVFDDDCGGFGIRPQRGASDGSKATPLLV
jgi:hypothetical protein